MAADGVYGVGHNSFFTTADGKENWILYHANAEAGQDCSDKRSPRMQRFTWKPDGSPDFGKPVALKTLLKRPSGE
jgi:GH43 family beta-xylosidase